MICYLVINATETKKKRGKGKKKQDLNQDIEELRKQAMQVQTEDIRNERA